MLKTEGEMIMKTLRIKGKGCMCFIPDWIELVITVESVDENYDNALKYHAEKIKKLEKCLEIVGLDVDDLKTLSMSTDTLSDFGVSLNYENYIKNGIKISQMLKIGMPYILPVVENTVNEVLSSGISAEITLIQTVLDKEKLEKEVIEKVVKTLKKKAKALARAANSKLSEVVSIEYHEKNMETERYISQDYYENSFAPIVRSELFNYNFLSGELEMEDEVEVVWKLKRKDKGGKANDKRRK